NARQLDCVRKICRQFGIALGQTNNRSIGNPVTSSWTNSNVVIGFFGHGPETTFPEIRQRAKRNLARRTSRSTVDLPDSSMRPFVIFNPGAGSVSDREKIVSQLKRLKPIALKMTRR